jgi:hypothetical protein
VFTGIVVARESRQGEAVAKPLAMVEGDAGLETDVIGAQQLERQGDAGGLAQAMSLEAVEAPDHGCVGRIEDENGRVLAVWTKRALERQP